MAHRVEVRLRSKKKTQMQKVHIRMWRVAERSDDLARERSGHHLVNHEIEEWWVLVGTRGPELLSETAPAVVPPPRPLPPTENRKNVYPNTPHLIVARLAPATSYESSGHPRTWMQQVCDVQLGGHRFPGTPGDPLIENRALAEPR